MPRRGLPLPGPLTACALLLAGVMVFALSIGSYPVGVGEILRFFAARIGFCDMAPARLALLDNLLFDVRLPRVLTAVLVGMSLSVSGASFQAVFRNPLVSPDLLGVLAGAAFGAALAMLFDASWLTLQVTSFACGIAAVALAVAIGNLFGSASVITLLLGGLISSASFAAMLSLIKYVADPENQLPAITYWLMGNLGMARLGQLAWLIAPVGLAVALLSALGRALDAMSMGDDEALGMGVCVIAVRYAVIVAATLVSAMSVSLAGMVGWVGLLMPHLVRLLLGPGNARLLPASALLGASFLVLADGLSRTMFQVEIPIGIVTECLGIPAFLLVLHRARKGWG